MACTRKGIYKVTFTFVGHEKDGAFFELASAAHPDSPLLSTREPYVGALCPCELEVLRAPANDKKVARDLSFAVETLYEVPG